MFSSIDFGNGFRFSARPDTLEKAIARVRHDKSVGLIESDMNEVTLALDANAHALFTNDHNLSRA